MASPNLSPLGQGQTAGQTAVKPRRSLRSLLLSRLIPLLVLPLIAFGLATYSYHRGQLISHEQTNLTAQAEAHASRLQYVWNDLSRIQSLIASRTQLRLSLAAYTNPTNPDGDGKKDANKKSVDKEHHKAKISRIIHDASTSVSGIRNITISDTKANEVASITAATSAIAASIQLNSPHDLTTAHDVLALDGQGDLFIRFTAPLQLQENLIGYCHIEVDAGILVEPLADLTGLGSSGRILVGIADVNSKQTLYVSNSTQGQEVWMGLDTPHQHTADDNYLYGLATTEQNISLIVSRDRADILAPLQFSATLFILITGILALLALAVSVLLARHIARPMQELAQAAKDIDRQRIGSTSIDTNISEIHDVTTILDKMAQGLLQENAAFSQRNQELAQVAERTNSLVMITNTLGRITWVNQAFSLQTGWAAPEVKGQKPLELLRSPDADQTPSEQLKAALNKGQSHQSECQLQDRHGRDFWAEVDLHAITDSSGKQATSFVFICHLTTKKQEQIASLNAARSYAEEAAKAKAKVLARVSHDFRTPLNAIIGFSKRIHRKSDGRVRESMERIITNSEHLLAMITELLDLAKIEAGAIELQLSRLNTNTFTHEVCESLQSLAEAKGIKLVHVPNVENIMVQADPTRLRQILTNLIGNALKFTASGSVTVSNKVKTIEGLGRCYHCEVTDTGCGISSKDADRLFEPFKQLSAQHSQGYGLGLATSKEIAQLHQGDIYLERSDETGSTFSLVLPLWHEATSNDNTTEDDSTASAEISKLKRIAS